MVILLSYDGFERQQQQLCCVRKQAEGLSKQQWKKKNRNRDIEKINYGNSNRNTVLAFRLMEER